MIQTRTQARRLSRHPMQRGARLLVGNERIGWLGDPDRQHARLEQSQRIAHELIAAEHALAEAQSRYLAARRYLSHGTEPEGPSFIDAPHEEGVRREVKAAEAARDLAVRRIEQLRSRLHALRRAELTDVTASSANPSPIEVQPDAERGSAASSWTDRLFRRAAN